jgi:hypothetical protein
VKVVEDEHERLARCEQLEQFADGTVAAIALVLEPRRISGREWGQRRKDGRELGAYVRVECVDATWIEAMNVFVERVDEEREGEVTLELRGGAGEDELAARVGTRRELREQTGLADARLSCQLDRQRLAPVEFREETVERAEFRGAPDEMLGRGQMSRQ